jgi:hypothetical protein
MIENNALTSPFTRGSNHRVDECERADVVRIVTTGLEQPRRNQHLRAHIPVSW